MGDAPFRPFDAAQFGEFAQIGGVQPGIEMKRIGHVGDRLAGDRAVPMHPPGARGDFVERVSVQRLRHAKRTAAQPIVLEGDQADIAADRAERVHIGVAGPQPIGELDAELEGAAGCADEGVLIQPERLIVEPKLRDRGLADADRADCLGFNQADAEPGFQETRQRGSGHPAGGAAAGDDDGDRWLLAHRDDLCPRLACKQKGRRRACDDGPRKLTGRIRTCRSARRNNRGRNADNRSPDADHCSDR